MSELLVLLALTLGFGSALVVRLARRLSTVRRRFGVLNERNTFFVVDLAPLARTFDGETLVHDLLSRLVFRRLNRGAPERLGPERFVIYVITCLSAECGHGERVTDARTNLSVLGATRENLVDVLRLERVRLFT